VVNLFLLTPASSQTWQQLQDFPSFERDDGVSFVIGNNGYCGTGLTPWFSACADFHFFDMNTHSWVTIESLPAGEERQYASAGETGTHGFIFGGINGTTLLNDVWKYDPLLNSWEEKTPMPSAGRSGSSYFTIDSIAYIIGGATSISSAIDEVWAYDMINDSWHNKSAFPFGTRWRASSTSINDKGYLIFGKDENGNYHNELYEYDPIADSWTQISSFPGDGRTYSSLHSIAGHLALTSGLDSLGNVYSDLWVFNMNTMSWQQLNSLPSAARKGGMSFHSSNSIYYTTGINQSNVRLKETWKVEDIISVEEYFLPVKNKVYPNPTINFTELYIEDFNLIKNASFTLHDHIGRVVLQKNISELKTEIGLSGYSKGIYFLKYQNDKSIVTTKLIVQ
jgi:N-acetylneuraminic acid mutarotase